MDSYPRNDWRTYLAHSWGTSPDQKAKEKAYNHEYYEKHKQLLNSSRKKFGDKDTQRDAPGSIDDAWSRTEFDLEDIANIMAYNEEMGGYPPEVMENIKKHNRYIIDNITNLQQQVEDYLKKGNISDAERQQVLAQANKEINAALDMVLDLRKDSTKEYLAQLGAKPTSTPKSSSKSTAKKEEVKASPGELRAEAMAPKVNNKNLTDDWYRRGDEINEEYRRRNRK